jgi:hypothetical protein
MRSLSNGKSNHPNGFHLRNSNISDPLATRLVRIAKHVIPNQKHEYEPEFPLSYVLVANNTACYCTTGEPFFKPSTSDASESGQL